MEVRESACPSYVRNELSRFSEVFVFAFAFLTFLLELENSFFLLANLKIHMLTDEV